MSKEYRAPDVPFTALTGTGIVLRSLTGPVALSLSRSSRSSARPDPVLSSRKGTATRRSSSQREHLRTIARPPVVSREGSSSTHEVWPSCASPLRGDARALEGRGREDGVTRPGGKGFERAGRDELSSARGDQAETDGDEPASVRDVGVDGGDGAGDEQDDVIVVVVIVETGNPCRVRRAGVGEGRKREQGTQEEARKRRPAFHGPETIRRWDIARKWPERRSA